MGELGFWHWVWVAAMVVGFMAAVGMTLFWMLLADGMPNVAAWLAGKLEQREADDAEKAGLARYLAREQTPKA